jgi:hypothetical protein
MAPNFAFYISDTQQFPNSMDALSSTRERRDRWRHPQPPMFPDQFSWSMLGPMSRTIVATLRSELLKVGIAS